MKRREETAVFLAFDAGEVTRALRVHAQANGEELPEGATLRPTYIRQTKKGRVVSTFTGIEVSWTKKED
jgi:hypothetical protein